MERKNYFLNYEKVESRQIFCGHNSQIEPMISIVIPTYKRNDYMKEAFLSAIDQDCTDTDYEIVVVINSPDEQLPEFITEQYNKNVRVYRNDENIGMCGNINRCMLLARGEYVAYLHDDDLLLPNYIREIVKCIATLEDADCIIPGRQILYAEGEGVFGETAKKKQKTKDKLAKMLRSSKKTYTEITLEDCIRSWDNCFLQPTCGTLFRKKAFVDFGGFDQDWNYSFDFAFYLDFVKDHHVYLFHKNLGVYRMAVSATNNPAVQFDFYQIFDEMRKQNIGKSAFIKKYNNEIRYLNYTCWSEGTKKMIAAVEREPHCNKIKYGLFRIKRLAYYYSHNLCNSELSNINT